jgi:hypothetical protein
MVYVVVPDARAITVINGSTMALASPINLSGNPVSLAVNPTAALVYIEQSNGMSGTSVSAVKM